MRPSRCRPRVCVVANRARTPATTPRRQPRARRASRRCRGLGAIPGPGTEAVPLRSHPTSRSRHVHRRGCARHRAAPADDGLRPRNAPAPSPRRTLPPRVLPQSGHRKMPRRPPTQWRRCLLDGCRATPRTHRCRCGGEFGCPILDRRRQSDSRVPRSRDLAVSIPVMARR